VCPPHADQPSRDLRISKSDGSSAPIEATSLTLMATVSIGQADAVSSAFPEAREQCGNWVGVLGQEASIAWHRNLRA